MDCTRFGFRSRGFSSVCMEMASMRARQMVREGEGIVCRLLPISEGNRVSCSNAGGDVIR